MDLFIAFFFVPFQSWVEFYRPIPELKVALKVIRIILSIGLYFVSALKSRFFTLCNSFNSGMGSQLWNGTTTLEWDVKKEWLYFVSPSVSIFGRFLSKIFQNFGHFDARTPAHAHAHARTHACRVRACACVCVRVRACACVRVRACACVRVRACVRRNT